MHMYSKMLCHKGNTPSHAMLLLCDYSTVSGKLRKFPLVNTDPFWFGGETKGNGAVCYCMYENVCGWEFGAWGGVGMSL